MLDALKFAAIGIANKDFVPELCHYLIRGGTITAFDGLICVQHPIDLDMYARPHAKDMLKAVAACMETKSPVAMHMTQAGKIAVKAGAFKAFIPCLPLESAVAFPEPEGTEVPFTPQLFHAIGVLSPFMAVDASRPWAMGIRISGDCAYVTNNIILIQHWHGAPFPHEIIIPAAAVKELVRIGKVPTRVLASQNAITFYFGDKVWFRAQLIDGKWPENVERVFNAEGAQFAAVPNGFYEALASLRDFADDRDRVFFRDGELATHASAEEGASVAVAVPPGGLYNGKQLRALEGVATGLDFSFYPNPVPFKGSMLRGVICGMRQ